MVLRLKNVPGTCLLSRPEGKNKKREKIFGMHAEIPINISGSFICHISLEYLYYMPI